MPPYVSHLKPSRVRHIVLDKWFPLKHTHECFATYRMTLEMGTESDTTHACMHACMHASMHRVFIYLARCLRTVTLCALVRHRGRHYARGLSADLLLFNSCGLSADLLFNHPRQASEQAPHQVNERQVNEHPVYVHHRAQCSRRVASERAHAHLNDIKLQTCEYRSSRSNIIAGHY